jgi:ribosomal RNA assembly protein
VDKLLASGEYFLKEEQRRARRLKIKDEKHAAAAAKLREEKRNKPFIPPKEPHYKSSAVNQNSDIDVATLKKKIKNAQKKKSSMSS